ncbi:MAG TPA: hypothetical protein ENJ28_01250 [Gammaproteobacteria bacterium]|nr:hypothetical protein [Gammaproteobacteria bacterium]
MPTPNNMEFIKKYKNAFTLVVIFLIGYVFGEIHFHNSFSLSFKAFKNIFSKVMVFAEFLYYILASALIIFAYFQYIENKRRARKEKVEFAYKLFNQYVDDILIFDKKYNSEVLKSLTKTSPPESKEDFNKLLNKIDTMSAAFIHNLADNVTGYTLFGKILLGQISSYSPAIKRIYGSDYKKIFEHIFTLYGTWSDFDGKSL